MKETHCTWTTEFHFTKNSIQPNKMKNGKKYAVSEQTLHHFFFGGWEMGNKVGKSDKIHTQNNILVNPF
jgi:hypothetical protein